MHTTATLHDSHQSLHLALQAVTLLASLAVMVATGIALLA